MSMPFPSIRRPSEVSWRLRSNTQTHVSPLDGTMQTLRLPGARWAATLAWPSLVDPDRRVLEAWLASLNGRAGRFFFGPPHAARRSTGGWFGPAPYISGPNQVGASLVTGGWHVNTNVMRAGDYFSYIDVTGRRRLHIVTSDVSSNASGFATFLISPTIRRPGADGAPLELFSPTGVFMLADDESGIATRPPLIGSVTLDIVEALT